MKSGVLVSLMLMVVARSAMANGGFEDLPYYDGRSIHSPYSPFVQKVLNELYSGRSRDVFDLGGTEIAWNAAPSPGDAISVAKIKCPEKLECIIMSVDPLVFLITFSSNYQRIIDHSMIYAGVRAEESYYDKDTGLPIGNSLFTSFAGGGLYFDIWPIDIEEGDIFCSEIADMKSSRPHQFYKRRITSEGKIENKHIDSWDDCKAPW